MAYTTIDKSTDYFNTVLYTGNGSTNAITGVGFQPDWVSIKRRSGSASNGGVFDVVRGVTKLLSTSLSDAEDTRADSLTAFGADGFTLGADTGNYVNTNSETFVSWNWKAGGSASSNSDGDITSSVSANTTAGFSVVGYTGTGTAGDTIGHGLGIAPKVIIIKNRSSAFSWEFGHSSIGFTKKLKLDTTSAEITDTGAFNNTDPAASVFTVGNNSSSNGSGNNMIAYCFAEIQGFSKFGSYTGNGSTDGPFVYTGFKPAWVLQKNASATQGWQLQDNKRLGYNPDNYLLQPNSSQAESSVQRIDIVSNGFKVRTTDAGQNTNGNEYIYMAFASEPLVSSAGIPCTAR